MIIIKDFNATYIKVEATSEDEWYKLYNFFSIPIPGIEHSQLYKAGLTDGQKHFINAQGMILFGLKNKVINFCKLENIPYQDTTTPILDDIDWNEFRDFINKLDLPFAPYKHQLKAVVESLKNKRAVLISATGSGKSLAIYIICRWFIYKNLKTLLLVPRIDLVHQMNQDFNEYFNTKKDKAEIQGSTNELEKILQNRKDLNCEDITKHIHMIFGGQEKNTDKLIKISTRDSLSLSQDRVNPEYFKDINVFIGDEIHTIGCATASDIVKECNNSNDMYKLGFTGSLSDSTVDNLIIEGLIGKTIEIIRMKQLMDLGLATNILIQPLYLKYNQNIDKEIKKMSWVEENKFIRNHIERNKFIARLANSFKDKNVMIIYQNKDAAQSILSEIIKLRNPDKEFNVKNYQKQNSEKCYLSWGETKSENRNEFRGFLEESEGNILLGTTSIISTGINIKNVHVFIFANIGKKDTLTIQAVGRLVRLHKSKDSATIYDIVDDCRYYTKSGNEYPNYHYKHWIERLGTYTNEEFDVLEPKKIQLKVDDKALF